MKISKNKKMRFFLMSQGSLNPKIRFLCQKICSVARVRTDTHTHTKVTTVVTLSGFQEFVLQPIKDRRKNPKIAALLPLPLVLRYRRMSVYKGTQLWKPLI